MAGRQRLTLAATFAIMLGLAPMPHEFFAHSRSPYGMGAFPFIFDIIALTPFMPFALALAGAFTRIPMPRALILLTFMIGVPVTLLSAGFAGPGFTLALVHGVATMLAIAGTVALHGDRAAPRRVAQGCLGIALAAATWSLASAGAASVGAQTLANGRPYCVAHHGKDGAVRSIADLRGLRFVTTRSGYKSTSDWRFHGLLLIEEEDGVAAWNWSPRALAWRPLRPIRRIVSVNDVCAPRHGV